MSDDLLLPDGAGKPAPVNDMLPGAAEGTIDVSDLHLNISEQEASAEGRSFENMPRGMYHVKVVKGEVKACGPESKNPGKPYYNLDLVVQSGPYEGRHVFDNIMLFAGATYSLVQLMKALGMPTGTQLKVPTLAQLVDKDLNAFLVIKPARGDYEARNEVKSYMPYDPAALTATPTKATSKQAQLLP